MKEETLIAACHKVYNDLYRFALSELNYEKALEYELRSRGVKCESEVDVPLPFTDSNNETHFITSLRMDLLVKPNIVLELKTVKGDMKKDDAPYYQVKRYEKLINAERAYLINFGIKGVEIYDCSGDLFKRINDVAPNKKQNIMKIDI